MPDPIPAEALVAATDAISRHGRGTSPAQLARVALEAAVPIIRARDAEGTVTEWGVRLTGDSGVPMFQASPSAEDAMATRLGFLGVFDSVVVSRQVGPWTEAPETMKGDDNAR